MLCCHTKKKEKTHKNIHTRSHTHTNLVMHFVVVCCCRALSTRLCRQVAGVSVVTGKRSTMNMSAVLPHAQVLRERSAEEDGRTRCTR